MPWGLGGTRPRCGYHLEAMPGNRIRTALDWMRRVLRLGGRIAITTWEALANADDRVPARIRAVDTEAGPAAAGFAEVTVRERPHWREAERAMSEEASALDPGDDPGLRSLHDEGVRVLLAFDLMRRVLATATA